MWTPIFFLRYTHLPISVEGITVPNDDGTFDIYINSHLTEAHRAEALAHELEHIRKDHFYNDILPIELLEAEANNSQTSSTSC